jgi:hypothetical protein
VSALSAIYIPLRVSPKKPPALPKVILTVSEALWTYENRVRKLMLIINLQTLGNSALGIDMDNDVVMI